ncbi:transcriptional regulator [Virgibacillus pantothenticus]|uniref:IclR family transcriptional regulator n=1 Tax=Virgibacillus pantothenticus TaxID=1473 RepID=UPI001B12AFF4|nr:IclR family transcriptional regulator [Virgibacillus pantothenticus]GIP62852.1 transcriptional regulator [Virgibacillus pantothenticus]
MRKDKEILSSVTNAMRILRLYHTKQRELSFTEIKKKLQFTQGNASRLIAILVKEGFLTKNPRTNHYRLGLSILSLGGAIFSHHEMYREALPIIKDISKSLKETVHLCLMENEKVVYLFRSERKPHPDRLVTQIGRTSPIHCTSEGLCILAFQSKDVIQEFLSKPLYAYTPYTITDAKTLTNCLIEIRKKDYCYLESTYYEGYTSIAVPIRSHTEEVVASLSVIGHTSRFTTDKLNTIITQMKDAGDEISNQLGYI